MIGGSITFFMDLYNACSCHFHIRITTVFFASYLFENDVGGLGNEGARAEITLFYITADISIASSGCKDSFTNKYLIHSCLTLAYIVTSHPAPPP